MTCNVIITPQNGHFLAQVAELPFCKVEADSRDQALSLIQKRLEEIVSRSEIVQLKISKLGKGGRVDKRNGQTQSRAKAVRQANFLRVDAPIAADDKTVHLETPWEYYGIFKDDPTWLPLLEEIERKRDRHWVYPKKKKPKKQ